MRLTHSWIPHFNKNDSVIEGHLNKTYGAQPLGQGRYFKNGPSKPYEVDDYKARRNYISTAGSPTSG